MKPIQIQELHLADAPSDVLWQRNDIILVAAGSGPCLRELYYRALAQKKLHQLLLCQTNGDDYTMGSAENKIIDYIKKAAVVPGVQVVILYLNCLDILTRLDFDYLEQSLSEETGVTVRCFFRGPLAKMDIRHFMPVKQFMQTLPPEKGAVQTKIVQLPPLATDIAGVVDCLPKEEAAKILVAPSGCRACLRDGDLSEGAKEQYYLDTKKQDFVFGMEDACLEQCQSLVKKKEYTSVNLISSAVAAFIGFDGDWIARAMNNDKLQARSFNMDGFNDAMYGANCAQELLAAEEAGLYTNDAQEVLICGYSPLLCGEKEHYAEHFAYIRSLGYKPRFLGEEAAGKPKLCWVVSTAGIMAARFLQEKYAVPMLISCPVGGHALKMWQKNVRELCIAQSETRQLCIHNYSLQETDTRKLLLLGDPVQIMGVAHFMWHEGFQHIKLATLCNTPASRKLYRFTPGADKWLILVDSLTALQDLCEEADIVFADTLLVSTLKAAGTEIKKHVPLPWGMISGRNACVSGSGALGKNILRQLQMLLN